jgi:hypothetical protein
MKIFLCFLLIISSGCANTHLLEQSKREAAYRRLLDENQNTTTPTAGPGPIEMPKEWMDQWKK